MKISKFKSVLLITVSLMSGQILANNYKKVDPQGSTNGASFYVGTVCIGGHLHSFASKSDGISIVQLFKDGKSYNKPNKPIACEEEP